MTQLDDNLTLTDGGNVVCTQCKTLLGNANDDPLANAIKRERPSRDAGPGVHADPKIFTTREIVLRQFFCPGCSTVLATEIVPRDEPSLRTAGRAQDVRNDMVSTIANVVCPPAHRAETLSATSTATAGNRSFPSCMCGAKSSIGDRHEKRRSVHRPKRYLARSNLS
jgi:hypothetical protein